MSGLQSCTSSFFSSWCSVGNWNNSSQKHLWVTQPLLHHIISLLHQQLNKFGQVLSNSKVSATLSPNHSWPVLIIPYQSWSLLTSPLPWKNLNFPSLCLVVFNPISNSLLYLNQMGGHLYRLSTYTGFQPIEQPFIPVAPVQSSLMSSHLRVLLWTE